MNGEFRIQLDSDGDAFKKDSSVYVGSESENTEYKIAALRKQGRFYVLALDGIRTREEAEKVCGKGLYVNSVELPDLPSGEYYHHQIIGMKVITVEGRELGKVVDIISTGANDVYEVRASNGKDEILIPAIKDVVVSIDVEKKLMTIKPLVGMLNEGE